MAAQAQRACKRGELEACFKLGQYRVSAYGVPKDEKRAVALFRRACDGGYMEGCVSLGLSYEGGIGVAKDVSHAVRLLQKACDGDLPGACYGAGLYYAAGHGVDKDARRAVQLLEKACRLGYAEGCYALGVGYLKGTGLEKDPARGNAFLTKACRAGKKEACAWLRQRTARKPDPPPRPKVPAGLRGATCQRDASGRSAAFRCRLLVGKDHYHVTFTANESHVQCRLPACGNLAFSKMPFDTKPRKTTYNGVTSTCVDIREFVHMSMVLCEQLIGDKSTPSHTLRYTIKDQHYFLYLL